MPHYSAPHLVVTTRGVGTFTGLRLPPGERWQWATTAAGGGSMRMRWGDRVTAALQVLVASGMSPLNCHPGSEVFVEFDGVLGEQVWIFVSGADGVDDG